MAPQTRSARLKRPAPVAIPPPPSPATNPHTDQDNPLQDITDRFHISPPTHARAPVRTRRRRAKIPRAKLQLAAQEPSYMRQPPSSPLPPSSPPSTSSRDVVDLPIPNDNDNTPSDPFGFLAIERKLKAVRQRGDEEAQDIGYSSEEDLYLDEDEDKSIVIFPTPLPGRKAGRWGTMTETPRRSERKLGPLLSPDLPQNAMFLTPPPPISPLLLDSPEGERLPEPDKGYYDLVPQVKRRGVKGTRKAREIGRKLEAKLPKRSRKVGEERAEVVVKRKRPRKVAMKGKAKDDGSESDNDQVSVLIT